MSRRVLPVTAFTNLKRKILGITYLRYASLIDYSFKAGMWLFVASIPCATGLSQFSASMVGEGINVSGRTTKSSRGASAPILGWKVPNKFMSRIAYDYPSDIQNVEVSVNMASVESLAKTLQTNNTDTVRAKFRAKRMASDEPETAAIIAKKGLMDIDITAMRAGDMLRNFFRATMVYGDKIKMRKVTLSDWKGIK